MRELSVVKGKSKSNQIDILTEERTNEICSNVYDMKGNIITPKVKDVTKITKKKGKTEVDPIWYLEDLKRISEFFIETKQYKHYLVFMIELLMGRRIGDTVCLKYNQFFFEDGSWRIELELQEEKTDKYSTNFISDAVKKCMERYFELTNIDPMEHYNEDIFRFSKKDTTRRDAAFRAALKKAITKLDIKYPVSTHSVRKSFGYWIDKIHPNDPHCLDILQNMYRHSSKNTTMAYIGITKEHVQQYSKDLSTVILNAMEGKKNAIDNTPVVSLKTNDLRDLLNIAYQEGIKNANGNANDHIKFINEMMDIVEEIMIK